MTKTCGGCTLCCKVMALTGEELQKPRGLVCHHLIAEKGCGIYDTRPYECRAFKCQWLTEDWLHWPEEMRPDRCHVMFYSAMDNKGLVADCDPDQPGSWRNPYVLRALIYVLKTEGAVYVRSGETEVAITAPPAEVPDATVMDALEKSLEQAFNR